LQTIQAQIRNGFSQPELSVKLIAAKLGVSPRYVQELLHKAGTTFTDRVKDLRLQKAHAMLTDRNCDHLRIIDIAYACGFSEVSVACTPTGLVRSTDSGQMSISGVAPIAREQLTGAIAV